MKTLIYLLSVVISFSVFNGCRKQNINTRKEPLPQNYAVEDIAADTEVIKAEDIPILFSLDDRYGYLDKQLQILVQPIYFRGFNYTDHGYAVVYYNEKSDLREGRILDCEGKIVFRNEDFDINILYDDIISYTPGGERYPRIIKFRNNTFITDASGSEAALVENDIVILVRFTPGIERGYIDSSGNRLLPDLDFRRTTRGFSEERAVVVLGDKWNIRIMDINGNFYGDLDFYRTGRNFSEGLLPAETKDRRTGYINRDGDFAFFVPIVSDIPDYDESPLNATDFKEGYALIQTVLDPPVWRIIDNQGTYVSEELPLSFAQAFSAGLSCVKTIDAGYGYIDTNGKFLIAPVFDYADSFNRGYARIKQQGRDGIINTTGDIFWSDDIVKRTAN